MSVKWDTHQLQKKVDDLTKRNVKTAALYLVGVIRSSFGSAPRQLTQGSVNAQKRYEARVSAYQTHVAQKEWRKQERLMKRIEQKNDRNWRRAAAKAERIRTARFRKNNIFDEL